MNTSLLEFHLAFKNHQFKQVRKTQSTIKQTKKFLRNLLQTLVDVPKELKKIRNLTMKITKERVEQQKRVFLVMIAEKIRICLDQCT